MNAIARLVTVEETAACSSIFLQQEALEELSVKIGKSCSDLSQQAELSRKSESETFGFLSKINLHLSHVRAVRDEMLTKLAKNARGIAGAAVVALMSPAFALVPTFGPPCPPHQACHVKAANKNRLRLAA